MSLAYAETPAAAPALPGLIIDLFAGGGGVSEGIFAVTGRHPDIAANHDADAIGMHEVNHPSTLHLCEDIRRIDPRAVLRTRFPGRTVDLLHASPDCTDHSKAKGGAPKNRGIRGLAWEVLRWAAAIRRETGALPRMITLENVEEWQDWGPLHRYGKRAGTVQRKRRKELFNLWVSHLRGLGFQRIELKKLRACNHGAPTTRERLFVVAVSDGLPIVWPERTHAPREELERPGLFTAGLKPWRSAAECIDWSVETPSIFDRKRPLAPATRRRIAKGVKRFVIEAAKPFIVNVTHTKSDNGYVYSADDPLRTATTAKGGEFVAVAPMIVPRYGERPGQEPRVLDATAPYPVAVPTGNGGGLAVCHVTKFSENSTGTDPGEPLHTALAGAPRHGIVAAYLGRQFGTTDSGRSLEAAHPTVMGNGGGGKSQIVAATLDAYYATGTPASPEDPLRTATVLARHGLSATYLEQANTDMVGHDARDPVSTIVGKACTQRPVEVQLEALGAPEGSRRRQVLAFLWEHFGEPSAADWADPSGSKEARLRFGLVLIAGVMWQIADIGMRMLLPRELFNAQGFRPDYVIDHTADGRKLTKRAQTSCAGNSVSPPAYAALLRSLLSVRPGFLSLAVAA